MHFYFPQEGLSSLSPAPTPFWHHYTSQLTNCNVFNPVFPNLLWKWSLLHTSPHPHFLQVTSSTISWAPWEFTGLGITQEGLSWRKNLKWFSNFRLQDSSSVVSEFLGNNYKPQSLLWVLTPCFSGQNSSFGIRQKWKQIQRGRFPLKILFIKTSYLIGLIQPLPCHLSS